MINKKNLIYESHKKIKEAISARKKLFFWRLKGKPVPPPHVVKQKIVKYYAEIFKIHTLIETGTYRGEMIDSVLHVFSTIISIEVDPMLAQRAQQKFSAYSHINVIQGDSGTILPVVIKDITQPCLFWLDAHFSGGVTSKGDLETPIAKELNVLLTHCCSDHVILIDDARNFIGQNSYPTMEEVKSLVRTMRPDFVVEEADDVVRIYKKRVKQEALES